MYLQCVSTVAEHVHRTVTATRDFGVQKGGKLPRKDLFTDAEKILTRTSSGMSLMERLARDPVLRLDLLRLLEDL